MPGPLSQVFANSLQHTDELEAHQALDQFLGFCRESYPAQHYMLFLLGHGLVVGRDAFLPDDNPDSAIGLKTLGGILLEFSGEIKKQNEVLELIGMHSCSMSSVEVAYELKGKANYMLGSQGISFVGSWPYRQLLTKIYSAVDGNIPELVKSLHSLCIQYSVDFMYAGYSADMCLCSLDTNRIDALTGPISRLATALQDGLDERRCREFILLAHWRSQSYWQETYTDLYDFCLCLRRRCTNPKTEQQTQSQRLFMQRDYDVKRIAIIEACDEVITKLRPQGNGPVVCADFIGPDCQYSHGLSIYFPWSQPLEDENDHVITNYGSYAFAADSAALSWLKFLECYFDKTERKNRLAEDANEDLTSQTDPAYQNALDIASKSFQAAVGTDGREFSSTSVLEGKVSPPDSGGACSCASTKNYSRDFSMSRGAAIVFGGGKSKPAKVV